MTIDVQALRSEFPMLARRVGGKPIHYLDSANTSHKPDCVIDAMSAFMRESYSPIGRSSYSLASEASEIYESARAKVAGFVNARSAREVVFTKNATESLNLAAQSWGRANLRSGDAIVLTHMEHHANIVPWQMLCERTGAVLKVAPIDARGELDLDAFRALLSPRTKLAAFTQVSNALGTVLPIRAMIDAAHAVGAMTLLDGAQAVAHERVDVRALGCDFYVFSSHKLYGPTGLGVLWAREAVLRDMPPWQGGGDMILTVSFAKTTYNELPYRFEAGTPHISGAVGLAAAIDYLEALGIERVHAHEQALLARATRALRAVSGLRIIGEAKEKTGVISFTLEGIHPHDLGTILDDEGVAVRTGHHCAMPVMEFFDVPATARASFGCYTDDADIDQLLRALGRAREVFG